MDGVEVVLGVLGERVSFSHQAADPRPQGAKPAFHVIGFALLLAAAAMRARGKGRPVGFPQITAAGAAAVSFGQSRAQVRRTLFTAVAERPGHDLAGSSAKGYPQPERLRFAVYKAPEFVELEHVTFLAGQQRVRESGLSLHFFPPASAAVSCSKLRRCV